MHDVSVRGEVRRAAEAKILARHISLPKQVTAAEGVEILKKAASCGYKPVTAAAAATR